jgi:hypothetical protein
MSSPATRRPTATLLLDELRAIFGVRLRSLVAYGAAAEGATDTPLTCLALVTSLGAADLEACAGRVQQWRREGLAVPLILPEEEFRRSFDAFPLEYSEMQRAHERIFGHDPFDGISIAQEDLRRACETQVKSHLMHLREGYIASGGQPQAVAELVTGSAPAFAALLRNVGRLVGVTSLERMEATRDAARATGLAEGVVADILALEQPAAMPSADPARLFPDYLTAVEQLAKMVDAWRA